MTRRLRELRERRGGRDGGFTLVEMLIAMALFSVLGAMLLTTVVSSRNAANSSRTSNDLNEEARVAVNRMARELRQSNEMSAVKAAGGAAVTTAAPTSARKITFTVDFNGNGVIDTGVADPEELTYEWDGTRILLSATDASGATVTRPVLAGQVSAFSIEFRSSLWQYDCNGDGKTVWNELDANTACAPASAGVGDNSGTLTATELAHVDSVVIKFSVLQGAKRQDYRTQVDLRNAS